MRNAEQDALSRRQLELERDLIASGMDPAEAEAVAAEEVLGLPAQRRARESMGAARAAAPPVSYGNAATLNNLDGAATELVVEDILGGALSRPAVPQSERVFQDDPTMGMAGMVAAREQAAAEDWERRGEVYGPQTAEYVEQYGQTWGPDAQPLTPEQQQARSDRRYTESDARHNPRAEEARIRRMADRAGISYAEAEAMVNQGYQDAGESRRMEPETRFVAGSRTQATPDFDYFSDAYKPLRNVIGDRRAEDKRARQEALVRRRMAQTNPLEYMNRDDISEWNRMVAADGMLRRGYRGATPLDVEQATQTALALQEQRRAVTSGLEGNTPAQQAIAEAKANAAQRQADPVAAGQQDLRSGRYQSPEAQSVLRADAVLFDDTVGGFSVDNEQALAAHYEQTYNIPAPIAARLAKQYADQRRRVWNTGGTPAASGRAPVGVPGGSGVGDMGQGFSG